MVRTASLLLAAAGLLLLPRLMKFAPHKTSQTAGSGADRPPEILSFGEWSDAMDSLLVENLQRFAQRVEAAGGRAWISPAAGALGRIGPISDTSQHNVSRYQEVRAADVMVSGLSLRRAYDIARGLSAFSGIGVYPDWRPAYGLHLDVRADRSPLNPATWAGVRDESGAQVYVSLAAGLSRSESVA